MSLSKQRLLGSPVARLIIRFVCVGLAFLLFETASAGEAEAAGKGGWSRPVVLYAAPGINTFPSSLIASDGRSLTWDGVRARTRTARGRLGKTQRIISSRSVFGADFAVAPDGKAAFLFGLDGSGVSGKVGDPNGVVGRESRTPGDLDSSSDMAVFFGPADGLARTVISDDGFTGSRQRGLFLQTLDQVQGFGPRVALGEEPASDVSVAVDRDGDAIIVWTENGHSYGPGVQVPVLARTLSREGALGPAMVVSRPNSNADSNGAGRLEVTVAPDGSGHVVWPERVDPAATTDSVNRLMARSVTTDGALGDPFTVLRREPKGGRRSAAFADGRTIVTWVTGPRRFYDRVRARILSPTGPGRVFAVSSPSGREDTVGEADVVTRGNDAIVLWNHQTRDRPGPGGRQRSSRQPQGVRSRARPAPGPTKGGLRSRSVSSSERLGIPRAIVDARSGWLSFSPRLAANGRHVTATWNQLLPGRAGRGPRFSVMLSALR